jgi:hypothetical protein
VPYAPGFSRHGIDEGAVVKKFNAVTAEHLNQTSRDRIVEAAMALDNGPSCAALTAALAQAHPA